MCITSAFFYLLVFKRTTSCICVVEYGNKLFIRLNSTTKTKKQECQTTFNGSRFHLTTCRNLRMYFILDLVHILLARFLSFDIRFLLSLLLLISLMLFRKQ